MSYKEKPQLKLFSYMNNEFVLRAIIDDYAECSFERNLYQAGIFTITINFNIPNSQLFQRGLFIQFGNDPYDFGEIYSIQDSIGEDGKGSQLRTITGYDARYLLKRRVIKNLNANGMWQKTAKGEIVLRNLIKDQCGESAELRRRLPINNVIPENGIGKDFSVSEAFSNLYEVCVTIATQSEIGWRVRFEEGELTLEVYSGQDKSATVRFDTSYDSLANGEFTDSSESFSNAIYVGGKGQNDNRDIYEGENAISGEAPAGLDRFECWDNQSSMKTEAEYEAEAIAMLTQYGQTVQMAGNGLAKCPYVYKEQYNVGDWITVAFSGKSAKVQILSITEHWAWGAYDIQFNFGKPQPTLNDQLQIILRKIQSASNKASTTDSVRWYNIPVDSEMPPADVTYNTIGFIGDCGANGATFQLYLDDEGTGAKTYHMYFKQLVGSTLTLTTGKPDATNLTLNSGTYVAIIYVDENGNITTQGTTITNVVESGNYQAVSSDAVHQAIESGGVPLGTWVSFENDSAPNGEWLGAGAFDPNTYPALAMMLGGNTVPERFDHSRLGGIEKFTTNPTSSNPATAEYDGFIGVASGWSGYDIYINGEQVTFESSGTASNARGANCVPIRRGDTFYFRLENVSFTYARWYKHPLFIKATPTSSDSDYEGTLNAIREFYVRNNTYSTEEVWTGGYWIDGKKIYRKVIIFSSARNFYNGDVLITSAEVTSMSVERIIKGFSFKDANTTTNQLISIYKHSDGSFRGWCGASEANGATSACIEYTKTND